VRWDSPFALGTAGTLAIHVILIVVGDAVVVTHPHRPPPPAPHIEMVEIEVPPMIKAEPPPPITPPDPIEMPAPPQKVIARTQVRAQTRTIEPPPVDQPVVTDPQAVAGGDQVVVLADAPPSGTGVAVGVGKRTSERVGRGGSGGGTGGGSGSGAAPAVTPMSVATIKKRALPKGDYGYFDAGKDYPAEARQAGIEGAIRVRLVVDEHGKVTSSVLLNRLGHGLDELALRRASQIEFEPALDTDDHAVASVVVWTFNMTLPK
jgi:protein TonB